MDEIIGTKDYAGEQDKIEKLGENHVFFLPYLMGERSPHNNPNARGTFIGLTMDSTRADMTQAVLEGVAFAIRDSVEVARALGIDINSSKICGGGAKSALWKRMFANILNAKLECLESEQGPGMGGAMLAMVACGAYETVQAACEKLVTVSETVKPEPELTALYEKRYQQFRKIYPAVKTCFPKFNKEEIPMYFENIPVIPYEGPASANPLAFKFYNPDQIVLGKPMREHLPFAMAWWHNLCAAGTDMFGRDTADKSFGVEKGTMEHAKAKVDAGFEFMQKLGIEFYCFHDVDVAPEGETLAESIQNLEIITDYLLEKQNATGIKPLWVTANMFSNKMFMAGAATSPSADVYAIAAGKVKAGIDAAIKLGAPGYVFWGGREGYETLLNTDSF